MEQSSPSITYVPRPGATPETEASVLAQIYRFVLQSRKADEPAFEPAGCGAATLVRDMEEVSHVDRRPD